MSAQAPDPLLMPSIVRIMGPSISVLALVFKYLLSAQPWMRDPFTLPTPGETLCNTGIKKMASVLHLHT